MDKKNNIENILIDRGKEYGNYKTCADLVEGATKLFLTHNIHKGKMAYIHEYTIRMILVKLGRLCNGNPNHVDSWNDIIGYCTLLLKELDKE